MLLSYIFLIIGVCLSIWGSQTRGSWSQNIAIVGGLIWLCLLIFMFYSFGIKVGFVALFVSIVVGAICENIFPKII